MDGWMDISQCVCCMIRCDTSIYSEISRFWIAHQDFSRPLNLLSTWLDNMIQHQGSPVSTCSWSFHYLSFWNRMCDWMCFPRLYSMAWSFTLRAGFIDFTFRFRNSFTQTRPSHSNSPCLCLDHSLLCFLCLPNPDAASVCTWSV